MNDSVSQPKIHHLPRSMRISLFVATGILIALSLLPPFLPSTKMIADPGLKYALLLLLTLPSAAWFYVEASSSRIVITSAGIEIFSVLYRISSSWENVNRLDISPFGGQILHLREPGLRSIFPLTLWFRMSGYDRRIQLAPFVADRRKSDLLRDIQLFAPHAIKKAS